jgi:hypothetical protein
MTLRVEQGILPSLGEGSRERGPKNLSLRRRFVKPTNMGKARSPSAARTRAFDAGALGYDLLRDAQELLALVATFEQTPQRRRRRSLGQSPSVSFVSDQIGKFRAT